MDLGDLNTWTKKKAVHNIEIFNITNIRYTDIVGSVCSVTLTK